MPEGKTHEADETFYCKGEEEEGESKGVDWAGLRF